MERNLSLLHKEDRGLGLHAKYRVKFEAGKSKLLNTKDTDEDRKWFV